MKVLLLAHMIAALAGAPHNTAIHCTPALPKGDAGQALRPKGSPPTMLLSGLTCAYLNLHVKHSAWMFGASVHLIVHESSHLRGLGNEYNAESRAERLTPGVLREILHRMGYTGRQFQRTYRAALRGSEGDHAQTPWCYRHPC